jgi:hypothetical protein
MSIACWRDRHAPVYWERDIPEVLRGREMTTLESQKRFRGPMSVRAVGDLLYVPDFGSHRIQVYKKDLDRSLFARIFASRLSKDLKN